MLMKLAKRTIAEPDAHPKQINAYDKFMSGHDTAAIAEIYHIHERTALRWISIERSRRHERANPYEAT